MNEPYPGRRTESRGAITWLPRLQDLTFVDIFLVGHLVEHVYAVPTGAVHDLVANLQEAVTTVVATMPKRVRGSDVWRVGILPSSRQRPLQHPL